MYERVYKVYDDGSHIVGTKYFKKYNQAPKDEITSYFSEFPNRKGTKTEKKDKVTIFNDYFDYLFLQSIEENVDSSERKYFIKKGLIDFGLNDTTIRDFFGDLDTLINERIKTKYKNLKERVNRLKKKAHLNDFNYFVTITYDDKKHTEETFREKLKKCLSNLHYEKDFKYIGVFEKSPNDRLHFHALMYIPNGSMVGDIEIIKDYNFKKHDMISANQNTWFLERFGRNDFADISGQKNKREREAQIDYLVKYLSKTNEKIFYSRGLKTFIYIKINDDESNIIICSFSDFPQKYVFFDDVIERGQIINMRC